MARLRRRPFAPLRAQGRARHGTQGLMNSGQRTHSSRTRKKAKAASEAQPRCDAACRDGGSCHDVGSSVPRQRHRPAVVRQAAQRIGDENWDADPPLAYELPKAAAIAAKRGGRAKNKAKAATNAAADSKRTTPTAEVRREVSDAEKMRRIEQYAQAMGCGTIDELRDHFGEHDDDLYSGVWESANLDWPIGVLAPSWVFGGGKCRNGRTVTHGPILRLR